jgi:hypothetical protein
MAEETLKPQYILMHGSSVSREKVAAVVRAISSTARLIDDSDGAYLFEGDVAAAKEVIDGMIGEFSVTPLKKYEIS